MPQMFHLDLLEREVRRIKPKHIAMINLLLETHLKNRIPFDGILKWCEFDARCVEHIHYLVRLHNLGRYLSPATCPGRLENALARIDQVEGTRRSVKMVREIATIGTNILETYSRYHGRHIDTLFTGLTQQVAAKPESTKRKMRGNGGTDKGVWYSLSLSGTDYCLGHVQVSVTKAMPEKEVMVAVMTKEGVSHSPSVTAVVACTLSYVPKRHSYYQPFVILDTRELGLYDFTILINRVTKSFEAVKSVLVPDRSIRYVITPAP